MSDAAARPEATSGRALRLRPSLEPFPASDGNVYVLEGGVTSEFVIADATAPQRALLELLSAGVADAAELERRLDGSLDAPLATVVEQLDALGLLERPSALPTERYARQLLYFASLDPSAHPDAAQERLARARVVVLGCGGLGTWTASGLACAGVGELVLVDDDAVSISNLNRQILFRATDVARPKVEVAAEALAAFNPELRIETHRMKVASTDDVETLASGASLLVEVADQPQFLISRWVTEACFRQGVPHISGGQAPPIVRVGPLYVPGRTGCHACQETAAREAFPLFDELERWRRSREPSTASTLGPASGLIGSLLAMEAVHLITDLAVPATLGRGVAIDLRTLAPTVEDVQQRADCPVCG